MEQSGYSDVAYFIATMTKFVSAMFMAIAPVILLTILYQGGLGTVPVYDGNTRKVLFYVNNVVAALAFSGVWFSFSALVFRYSKKIVARLNKKRDAA